MRNLIAYLYQNLLKKAFFKQDPEKVHDRMTVFGRLLGTNPITKTITRLLFRYQNPLLQTKINNVIFANPVGLSAGFDKDANLTNILYDVGFGFEEVGSITLHPYPGNPEKRLHRLPNSKALVVYYGLKNIGVDKIIPKIAKHNNNKFPLNISVAKTNSKEVCDMQQGIEDYFGTLQKLEQANVGAMYTINISCPNTYGGEPFTTPERLSKLLTKVDTLNIQKPLFIKMPLLEDWNEFKDLLDIIVKHKVTGVTIANLHKNRATVELSDPINDSIKGGISGKPTEKISNMLIANTYKNYGDKLKIIGVGGIFSAEDAYTKIKLGASLVELITGMIYQGPQLIGQINQDLVELLKKDGYNNISEAVGEAANTAHNLYL